MSLPGLNPINEAPPAESTQQVATGAMVARLWAKISELELALKAEGQARRSPGPWLPLNPTYGTGWQAHSQAPHYRRLADNSVQLTGIVSSVGGGVSTNIFTLPTSLRPALPSGHTEFYFPVSGNEAGYTVRTAYIYAWNGSLPGRFAVPPMGATAGYWVSLSNVVYATS